MDEINLNEYPSGKRLLGENDDGLDMQDLRYDLHRPLQRGLARPKY